VRVRDEDLSEPQSAVAPVRHFVDGDGVGQLAGEVHERLGLGLEEGHVPGSAAVRGGQGRGRGEVQGLGVDVPDADEVGAEVRDDQEGARGVEHGLVRVRGVLALRVLVRCRDVVEEFGVDLPGRRGAGEGVGAYGAA
jgi:hypothetical protein